jgi:hypothetical protein
VGPQRARSPTRHSPGAPPGTAKCHSVTQRSAVKKCKIHTTIQKTIHFLRYFSDIHIRYMNDTKITEIGSVSRARYSAQPPPNDQSRDFVSIECVSKCIEHAFARWIHPWIHVRYGYDTQSIRYDTSYGEKPLRYMGKRHPHPMTHVGSGQNHEF